MCCRYMKRGILILALMVAPYVQAKSPQSDNNWNVTVAPYLWMAGLEGQTTTRGIESDVDVSFSDVLDTLDVGVLGHIEAQKGNWAFGGDLIYLKLGDETDFGPFNLFNIDTELEMTIAELFAAYRFSPSWEALLGARYTKLEGEIDISTPGFMLPANLEFVGEQDWTDPFVGLRYANQINNDWSFHGRADVGGFGVNSDLVWNASALFGYHFSENKTAYFGYRALDYDYEDGSGANKFKFDIRMEGPLIGIAFEF